MLGSEDFYYVGVVWYNSANCYECLAVGNGSLCNEVDSFVRSKVLFSEKGLFGNVDNQDVAFPVTGQEVVLILWSRAETTYFVIDGNQGLCDVFLDSAFVVLILFLLLNVMHGQLQLINYSLLKNLVDKPIRLR